MINELLQVFMVSADAELNVATLKNILASGHSRVPVHSAGNRCAHACPSACGLCALSGLCALLLSKRHGSASAPDVAALHLVQGHCKLHQSSLQHCTPEPDLQAVPSSHPLSSARSDDGCVCGGRQDIQGLVLIKELALVDPRDNLKVTSQRLRGLPALRADIAM